MCQGISECKHQRVKIFQPADAVFVEYNGRLISNRGAISTSSKLRGRWCGCIKPALTLRLEYTRV